MRWVGSTVAICSFQLEMGTWMPDLVLEEAKLRFKEIAAKYPDRLSRSRRLFLEERAAALMALRDVEYAIKERVAAYFDIKYAEVAFAGSAQVGFSPHKNRLFIPGNSDLDVACVSANLFQKGWSDTVSATRAFTDLTAFSGMSGDEIERFKEGILRRGMIRVEIMPRSKISLEWKDFESLLTRSYPAIFRSVSVAIYLNEYAFCWKQDSAIAAILRS